jgi:hypothetical protein
VFRVDTLSLENVIPIPYSRTGNVRDTVMIARMWEQDAAPQNATTL